MRSPSTLIHHTLLLAATLFPAVASAQHITFETPGECQGIGVYDTWEASPFRTGAIGNPQRYVAVCPNPDSSENTDLGLAPNPSANVLAVQRSRYGSNTFGARIDLAEPLCLGTATKYVHILLLKPHGEESAAMLVGLGKRQDWHGQSPDTEQFWVTSSTTIAAGEWNDLIFPITTNESVAIHSLVLVPDLASPHLRVSDFVAYVDDIEVNDNPKPRFHLTNYPLNFDAGQEPTRTDRQLTSLSIACTDETNRTIPVPSTSVYSDLTQSRTLYAKPGSEVKVKMSYRGAWMSGYVYVDWSADGQFTPIVADNQAADGSELVSYTYLGGYDSQGVSQANGNSVSQGVITCPTFTIPADTQPGIYRMRLKVDWDCDDPGGNSATGNLIVSNGGAVVDVLLNVHQSEVPISANQLNGDVLSADGQVLSQTLIPFGKSYKIKMSPAPGFTYTGAVLTHGYNLDGPHYLRDNRQYQRDTIPATSFTAADDYTIPASRVDGEVRIEGLFTPSADALPSIPAPAAPTTTTHHYSLDGRQLPSTPAKGLFIQQNLQPTSRQSTVRKIVRH